MLLSWQWDLNCLGNKSKNLTKSNAIYSEGNIFPRTGKYKHTLKNATFVHLNASFKILTKSKSFVESNVYSFHISMYYISLNPNYGKIHQLLLQHVTPVLTIWHISKCTLLAHSSSLSFSSWRKQGTIFPQRNTRHLILACRFSESYLHHL